MAKKKESKDETPKEDAKETKDDTTTTTKVVDTTTTPSKPVLNEAEIHRNKLFKLADDLKSLIDKAENEGTPLTDKVGDEVIVVAHKGIPLAIKVRYNGVMTEGFVHKGRANFKKYQFMGGQPREVNHPVDMLHFVKRALNNPNIWSVEL